MNPVAEAQCRAVRRRQAELERVCEGCMARPAYDPLKDCADCEVSAEFEETEREIAQYERSAKK